LVVHWVEHTTRYLQMADLGAGGRMMGFNDQSLSHFLQFTRRFRPGNFDGANVTYHEIVKCGVRSSP